MGSGSSKLTPEADAVPAKIRPAIHRWFEDVRRRKNENMSKKELLKDAAEEDESSRPHSLHDIERRSSSSSYESIASSIPAPIVEDKSIVASGPLESEETKLPEEHKNEGLSGKQDDKEDSKEEEEEKKQSTVVVEKVVAAVEDHETMEEEEDEEEEEEEDEEKGDYVCLGSPSFRVYCVQAAEENEEESKKGSTHKNSTSGDSTAESCSDEGQEKKTKKKGNRARRLKRAIRKGGPAVKNLIISASCYHPGCTGGDRARLLEEKAEA
ncbi:ABC transporter F family member 4-like [Juglans regia]|uniref:ABC transporter F family member 4-like n=2 Tax=Juglans regia TaxID=51240 RepID=A0A2I4HTC9_JUGRE|nr:ABC transporter F family member 4-like [Juglans regia]